MLICAVLCHGVIVVTHLSSVTQNGHERQPCPYSWFGLSPLYAAQRQHSHGSPVSILHPLVSISCIEPPHGLMLVSYLVLMPTQRFSSWFSVVCWMSLCNLDAAQIAVRDGSARGSSGSTGSTAAVSPGPHHAFGPG